MKEWRIFLDYIDYYVYNKETEEIEVQPGADMTKAELLYKQITHMHKMEKDRIAVGRSILHWIA